jgi:hypothetical protein
VAEPADAVAERAVVALVTRAPLTDPVRVAEVPIGTLVEQAGGEAPTPVRADPNVVDLARQARSLVATRASFAQDVARRLYTVEVRVDARAIVVALVEAERLTDASPGQEAQENQHGSESGGLA